MLFERVKAALCLVTGSSHLSFNGWLNQGLQRRQFLLDHLIVRKPGGCKIQNDPSIVQFVLAARNAGKMQPGLRCGVGALYFDQLNQQFFCSRPILQNLCE